MSISPATPLGRGRGSPVGRANVSLALLQLLTTAYPWANTPSRVAELPENIPANTMPALFLVIPREKSTQQDAFGLQRIERRYGAVVYCKKDSVRGAQMFLTDEMESILDSIDLCLKQGPLNKSGMPLNPPMGSQTLGGLVTNCWYDGEAQLVNASTNTGQFAVLAVPITVLIGN